MEPRESVLGDPESAPTAFGVALIGRKRRRLLQTGGFLPLESEREKTSVSLKQVTVLPRA